MKISPLTKDKSIYFEVPTGREDGNDSVIGFDFISAVPEYVAVVDFRG